MGRFYKLAFLFTLLIACLAVSYPNSAETSQRSGISYYTVRCGDTLYSIANRTNTTISNLSALNNLKNSLICPGQILLVEQEKTEKYLPSLDDIRLLARLIHAEARGETTEGKIAVGAVVLNRVNSPDFPNTVEEVVFQKNTFVYQFSPVGDGTINLQPDESAIRAAEAAASGEDPTGGALYFYNPRIAEDTWIRTLPVVKKIGNHTFASH